MYPFLIASNEQIWTFTHMTMTDNEFGHFRPATIYTIQWSQIFLFLSLRPKLYAHSSGNIVLTKINTQSALPLTKSRELLYCNRDPSLWHWTFHSSAEKVLPQNRVTKQKKICASCTFPCARQLEHHQRATVTGNHLFLELSKCCPRLCSFNCICAH